MLNELNNLAKHRDLIAVGSMYGSVDIGTYMHTRFKKSPISRNWPEVSAFTDLTAFLEVADTKCPLKVGDELFIGSPDDEPDPKMKFTLGVTLNEPQIITAGPLIETVHQLAGLVDGIVNEFARYL